MSILSGRVIYFVQGSHSGEREMGKAFAACKDKKLKPKMIFKEDLVELTHDKNSIFVIDDFKGETFQYLKLKDCLIVGPRCMYSCVKNGIPIPENDSPVFNLAMVGVVATASKLSRTQKEELASLIGYMGGIYTDRFTTDITHLITDGGKSPKYECFVFAFVQNAINIGLPVMSSSWVKTVWERSLVMKVSALDPGFLNLRLSPFKGLYISFSNLPHLTKRRLQNIIESHGGTYMSTLEQKKTSVLIVGEPEGRKFQHAQLWGIPCLRPSWIHESVEKGAAVKMIDHIVQSQVKCSTPVSNQSNFVNSVDISTIHKTQESNFISETDISFASTCSLRKPGKRQTETDDYKKLLNNIDLSLVSNAGLFLDGCKIFLSGFTAEEMDRLKRIINLGGATFFTQLTERLTHVIVGNAELLDKKSLIEFKLMGQTVSLKWLVASIEEGCPSRIESYAIFRQYRQSSPMSSPRGKEILQFDTTPCHNKRNLNKTTDFIKTPCQQGNKLEMRAQEELEYFKKQTGVEIECKSGTVEHTSLSIESIEVGPIFEGIAFKVIGFDNPSQIIKAIENLSGEVFSDKFQGKVDFTVVPLISFSDPDSLQTVTSLWLEDCYEQGTVVQVEYFHRPVSVTINMKPLEDCVFCTTGFLGKERSFLCYLAEALGAKIQDSFSCKDHLEKGVLRSTHLLCKSETGSKFNAAVKWGIPIVSKDWLLKLLESCFFDNKENEIIENATTPVMKENENYSKVSRESMKDLYFKQKNVDNLSFGSVGKSPFHISTPDTPYGQVFLNESQPPTPSTRKRWMKWIDDLPDLYHNSPEMKQFRKSCSSTPLNIVMKQLWVKFGGATIEGIDPETGDLLPDGPYKQWICKNDSTGQVSQNYEDNCLTNMMTFEDVSKVSTEKLNDKNFTSEVQEKSTTSDQDEYSFNEKTEVPKCSITTSWRYVKRVSCESDDGPAWDFGKPKSHSLTSNNGSVPHKKKRKADQVEQKQEDIVVQEEQNMENATTKTDRVFVISNIPLDTHKKLVNIIENLGGEISKKKFFDPASTHIIVDKPVRSEKLLCAIASGKWVLHMSYLMQCYQSRMFLPEEEFELGNEISKNKLPHLDPGSIENKLAMAAYRWRIMKTHLSMPSAFRKFKAVFCTSQSKTGQYKRLLEAGGGTILNECDILSATHVFWDKHVKLPVKKAILDSKKILILRPIYLGDCLMKVPEPNPQKYTVC
ncbi:DNA topoisomerase 2-binding protein 1-like isoform X2 [Cimex lectularius]|uniref:BRCT domain-containing protein n=1 Tax=Cimex lectularius TaxID=79782 RepID=A0A8I6RNV6_CIMLE|nr:DNA topoisomerase 2-binding protein 1-like isoform X2 [Cimex lectularius]